MTDITINSITGDPLAPPPQAMPPSVQTSVPRSRRSTLRRQPCP